MLLKKYIGHKRRTKILHALPTFDRGESFNFSKQITSYFDASYQQNHGVDEVSALSPKFNIIKNVKKTSMRPN